MQLSEPVLHLAIPDRTRPRARLLPILPFAIPRYSLGWPLPVELRCLPLRLGHLRRLFPTGIGLVAGDAGAGLHGGGQGITSACRAAAERAGRCRDPRAVEPRRRRLAPGMEGC